jgi:hypothetical protein
MSHQQRQSAGFQYELSTLQKIRSFHFALTPDKEKLQGNPKACRIRLVRSQKGNAG